MFWLNGQEQKKINRPKFMQARTDYSNSATFALILAISIASTRFWSSTIIPTGIFSLLETANVLLLFAVIAFYYRQLPLPQARFSTQVALFLVIPLIGVLAAAAFHQQSPVLSLLALKNNFLWLLYFVLHLWRVPVKKLAIVSFILGGVWIALTVGQQFTYPAYWFSTRNEETSYDFYRAGVYRFMIDDHHYALFILFYFFHRLLSTRNIWNFLPVTFALVGFYYFGTRQFALAAVVCVVVYAISKKGKSRYYAILLITLVAVLLFSLKDVLFGGYVELNQEQFGQNDENIRELSGRYFLFEYWPHWTATLTGNGLEHLESAYGKEMEYLNKELLFYKSDVGIIGAFNTFGIFYVINIFWLNLKGLRRKYYTPKNNWLRLFFLKALLLLIISEYYSYESTIPFYCLVLYMVDKAYEEKLESAKKNWKRKLEILHVEKVNIT